jgi:uncharacterized protein YcbX
MAVARIASMHVYPVKGCGGVAFSSADVAVTGLVVDGIGDREWMIVDATGRFVTQREYPRLALVAHLDASRRCWVTRARMRIAHFDGTVSAIPRRRHLAQPGARHRRRR